MFWGNVPVLSSRVKHCKNSWVAWKREQYIFPKQPLPACAVQHSERVKMSNTPWQIADSYNVTTKGRYIQANCNRAVIQCGSKTGLTLFIPKSGITHTFHTRILFYLTLVLINAFLLPCLQLKLSQNMTVCWKY